MLATRTFSATDSPPFNTPAPYFASMIIGASPSPSRYRIRVASVEIPVKCGPDILLNGLRRNLEGEADCPICQKPIRFRIENTRVEDLEPSQAVLHAVESQEGPGRLCVTCEASHIFDREECLRAWLSNYRGTPGSSYRLQDYMEHIITVESKKAVNN